jgi:hypothetical protein
MRLSNVCLRAIVCLTITSYLSRHCYAAYVMCVAASIAGGSLVAFSGSIRGVLIAIPSRSSFGENLRARSIRWLRALTASSSLSGQLHGSWSHPSVLSSSPSLGAQSRFMTCSKILFVPSTRPFTQGEYAGVTWCLHWFILQNSHTLLLSKCVPLSVMNVSGAMKALVMVLSASTIVLAIPAVLYLNAHTCWENVSRYSAIV